MSNQHGWEQQPSPQFPPVNQPAYQPPPAAPPPPAPTPFPGTGPVPQVPYTPGEYQPADSPPPPPPAGAWPSGMPTGPPRSRHWWWIGGAVVTVIALAAAGITFAVIKGGGNGGAESPQAAVLNFLAAAQNNDAFAAADLLDPAEGDQVRQILRTEREVVRAADARVYIPQAASTLPVGLDSLNAAMAAFNVARKASADGNRSSTPRAIARSTI